MKLYNNNQAPNPRRVRMLIAEKGISDIELVNLELVPGENLTAEFVAKNPMAKVPMLELDDGFCLAETSAICRYLDEHSDGPSLLGEGSRQRAEIDMWDKHIEHHLMYPVMHAFSHTSGIFADRMTPVAEYGKVARQQVVDFLPLLEARLQQTPFVAGEHFSVADITTICALDFARVVKLKLDESYPAILAWHETVKQRSSYRA